ncbi:MAG: ComEC/Rec2 family competence protein [Alphaproteobacteria bacterium]|nr:ComEC/Rec2 family competence protein [Alphaproteobacteria bacterium]
MATDLRDERERWILWAPVGLLSGIAFYFWLDNEPWPFTGLVLLLVFALPALLPHRHNASRAIWVAGALVFAGFALAQWETQRDLAPILQSEIGPRMVSGTIVLVEPRDKGLRIVLRDPVIPRLEAGDTPRRIRITVRTHGGIVPIPGQHVETLAMLRAPPPPAYPGGYDFARDAFFKEIGGVGYAVGPLRAAEPGPEEVAAASWWQEGAAWIQALRLRTTDRILETLPEPRNGVAAALLTGHRGAVADAVLETIRKSGLAHLLAISGLHLGLVAAIVFFVTRATLAAIEPLALRAPIKGWAAGAALVAAFLYLLISGGTVPTQRAFLMTAIVLFGVALGRQAISLRLVALAAITVMVISPHVVTGASFQLSFAAVIALVAVYEALRDNWPRWRVSQGPFSRLLLYFGGVAVTTIIANLATMTLVLVQFGRMAT